ncbi:HAD-like protein [Polychaeton citri CBS 116435]|uniref:HAD-like protein n=1 Tax=Polychaeton citri CBS 116435 TaxID=1314669 RepID=A0A9P4Q7L4_9PEZI|nr:HAD-like protein [Polychaeton citri CBS 116435]
MASPSATRIRGIVFDMDGTLCKPQNHMFGEMRNALSIGKEIDILDHVYALPTEDQQKEAHEKIQAIERKAMTEQEPQPGLVELMEWCDRGRLRRGICTRNFDTPVTHLIATHIPPHLNPFDPIVTREFRPPKPSPEGIWHIARSWDIQIPPTSNASTIPNPGSYRSSRPPQIPVLMVGDSIDDIIAGYEAGATTVLVESEGKEELKEDARVDVVVSRLDEIICLFESGKFKVDGVQEV